jgi:hypothetical protein
MVVGMDLRDRIDRFGNMRGQNLGLVYRGLATHRHLPLCMKLNGVRKRGTKNLDPMTSPTVLPSQKGKAQFPCDALANSQSALF